MSRGGGKRARVDCPVCGRPTAVSRATELLRRHLADGVVCAGSGQRVDLYGSGPVPEVTWPVIPAHRRKRHPLDRQVLGVYKPPPTKRPDCAREGCGKPWQEHAPKGMHGRGECLNPASDCPEYLPPGEDT